MNEGLTVHKDGEIMSLEEVMKCLTAKWIARCSLFKVAMCCSRAAPMAVSLASFESLRGA